MKKKVTPLASLKKGRVGIVTEKELRALWDKHLPTTDAEGAPEHYKGFSVKLFPSVFPDYAGGTAYELQENTDKGSFTIKNL